MCDIMYGSAKFKSVPIIDVTKENIAEVAPVIRGAIIGADFIAIDCELSGLGNRKRLNATELEERYQNTSNVAKTRSIISLGLSMFKLFKSDSDAQNPSFPFHVQTFNILTLCAEDYIVEPSSLRFLVEHGFDFCRQYAEGLPYYRGNDRNGVPSNEDYVRQLFMEIIRHRKTVVLHNGFIDLVFLYQNLYAQLPQTVHSFAADLADMFPNGIYDTKYISDYVCRKPASFLEYVFRSQQRKNIVNFNSQKDPCVQLIFPSSSIPGAYVQSRGCDPDTLFNISKASAIKVCPSFSNHGHCASGKSCPMSHDIDSVVISKDVGQCKSGKNRKRKRSPHSTNGTSNEEINNDHEATGNNDIHEMDDHDQRTKECNNEEKRPEIENCGGHRAGFDAFMTGFSFATFIVHSTLGESHQQSETMSKLLGVPTRPEFTDLNIINRIYLVCKDIPFMVRKSAFCRNSVGHSEKYTLVHSIGVTKKC